MSIILVKTKSKTLPRVYVLSFEGEARKREFACVHSNSSSDLFEFLAKMSQRVYHKLESPATILFDGNCHVFRAVITAPPTASFCGLYTLKILSGGIVPFSFIQQISGVSHESI